MLRDCGEFVCQGFITVTVCLVILGEALDIYEILEKTGGLLENN